MEKKVCLGKIVAAHGIRGEVKFSCYTRLPFAAGKFGAVETEDGSKKFQIKVVGKASSNVRIQIKDVTDRNTAEALVGTEFYVDRDVFPDLPDEEFYQMDIVGLKVCLKEKDNVIGEVIGFYNFGAGDIIEIKISGQKATEMLPFTKAYVPTININEGCIIVTSATMIFAKDGEA